MVSGLLEGLARKRNNVSYLLAGIASRYFPTEILPNSRNVAAFVVLGVDFVVIAAATLFLPFAAVVRYLGPNQELSNRFHYCSVSSFVVDTYHMILQHLGSPACSCPASRTPSLVLFTVILLKGRGQGHHGHPEQGSN